MPQAACEYLSEIEKEILRSTAPILLNETDEITVFGQRGLWANKLEVLNWKSEISLDKYQLNEDQNPEIIVKKLKDSIEYIHEIAIRYLKPPSPPGAGEIIISQEPNTFFPPAPPVIIRQQPPRIETPEPLIIREAPPPLPDNGRKVITISGKQLPPPPRKVVVERLAQMPPKPQSVIVERWLPYVPTKRKVIYKGAPPDPVLCKPRNIIVQWEAPEVCIKKKIKYLGVVKADPDEYTKRYGSQLTKAADLPQDILDIKYPDDLLEEMKNSSMLEGDVEALKLVDLDKEGLSIYRDYLTQIGILDQRSHSTITNKSQSTQRDATPEIEFSDLSNSSSPFIIPKSTEESAVCLEEEETSKSESVHESIESVCSGESASQSINTSSLHTQSPDPQPTLESKPVTPKPITPKPDTPKPELKTREWTGSYEGSEEFLRSIFNFMDYDSDGKVKLEEVKRTLDVLNDKFKRNYIELSAVVFLNTFDRNKDGYIDFQEFKESIREILNLK